MQETTPIFEYVLINFIFSALLATSQIIIALYFFRAYKKTTDLGQKHYLKDLTMGWSLFAIAYTIVAIRVFMWPYYIIDNIFFKSAASIFALGIIPIIKFASDDILGKNNIVVPIWSGMTFIVVGAIIFTTQSRSLSFYGSEWYPHTIVSLGLLFDFCLAGMILLILLSYHALLSDEESISNKMVNLGVLFFAFFILTFYEGAGLGSDLMNGWGFIIVRILIMISSILFVYIWFKK